MENITIVLADPIQKHNLFTDFSIKFKLLKCLVEEVQCQKTQKEIRSLLLELEIETDKLEIEVKNMQTTTDLLNFINR